MTAEEYVKLAMPNARAEKYKAGRIVGNTYWLIRDGRNTMYFASGNSKSKAWVNAKIRLKEKVKHNLEKRS
jgi:hypothetical protein